MTCIERMRKRVDSGLTKNSRYRVWIDSLDPDLLSRLRIAFENRAITFPVEIEEMREGNPLRAYFPPRYYLV